MRTGIHTMLIITLILASSCSAEEGSSHIGHQIIDSEDLYFQEEVEVAASFADRFYEPVSSIVEPDMSILGLPVEASEVFNLSQVLRSAGISDAPENLLENGFIVFNAFYSTDNPITAYETVSDWDQPVYVSSGIPLHMLHIFFDQILQNLEEKHLYEDLLIVCDNLYTRNLDRGCILNAAFFAVPLSLLDPSFRSDPSIADAVERELELIERHLGFEDSPIFGYREDYSQYVPRGHYTASEGLERYFKAMMWLGRLTLLLNGGEPHGQTAAYIVSEEDAREMTASALLIVSDLSTVEADGELLLNKWKRIYEITAFFAGFADDLSVPEYSNAAREIAGEAADTDLIWSPDFYHQFRDHVNTSYAIPSIYSGTGQLISMPDENGEFNPDDLQEAFVKTTGFRFLGQRYTPDSEVLGKLVFPAVGLNYSRQNRFMPTGLDVAAAFGSDAALSILEERGAFEYEYYSDSLASLTSMIEDYSPSDWHSTLYMSWLHCLYLLQKEKGEGYPDFMRNDAWARHTLSNFLASWAMLRHDTILYAKQSYTMEAGIAMWPDDPVPSAGFVEPVPEVYAELRATLRMAERGLAEFGLLDDEIEMRFGNATTILKNLQNISERELAGEQITADDADFLKDFARRLEIAISWGGRTSEGLETSLIADVHTDQNSGSVLEVASGNLDYCIVIYRRPDGNIEAAIGPVLSYYEFTWPMSDRLTDEAWREMLANNEPERPSWTEMFLEE